MNKYLLVCIFCLTGFPQGQSQDWYYKIYEDGSFGTFIDERDGQEYEWVRIGKQFWMAQNLNIGRIIYVINNKITDASIEKFCYNDRDENCIQYGGLYPNYVMEEYTKGERSRSICPDGWHLPSEPEWMILINSLGGIETAGNALKKSGIRKWSGPNAALADSIAFNALAGGFAFYSHYSFNEEGFIGLDFQVDYKNLGKVCYFWTSTRSGTTLFPRNEYKAFGFTGKRPGIKQYKDFGLAALSIRCVR